MIIDNIDNFTKDELRNLSDIFSEYVESEIFDLNSAYFQFLTELNEEILLETQRRYFEIGAIK